MSASQLIRHFDIDLRMTEMTTTSVTGFTLPSNPNHPKCEG